MTTRNAYARPTSARRLRAARSGAAAWLRKGSLLSGNVLLTALVGLVVLIGVLCPIVGADIVPASATIVPILAGGLLLTERRLTVLLFVVAVMLAIDAGFLGVEVVRPGSLGVVLVSAVFAYAIARTRARLGVRGLRGESMLLDLSGRLQAQGELPVLPVGWQSETVVRSAGGASFGGDFLVSALTMDGTLLEVALVDVSGKGIKAGTRALLLSGALGGLLGAVPPEEFLPAANDYLLRQRWTEGFATAVHVVIELSTGRYVVESAGHPPAAHFAAGSGTWRLTSAEGTVLGVLPKAEYASARGVLGSGDALLLYTDGLVEEPGRDLSVGVDKLLGEAERLVTRGFRNGARLLIDAVAPAASDDRALLLIWRD